MRRIGMLDLIIRTAAAALAALIITAGLPVLAADNVSAQADVPQAGDIYDGVDPQLLAGYTEEELYDDPGFWRLSGLAAREEGTPAEESQDTAPVQGSTNGSSPFNSNTYTHSDAHDRYVVIHGVDISSYQETIDWNAARKAGVSFALVRVGYRGYAGTGKLVEDSYYKTNLTNAPKAGVNTGVYIYSQAITPEEAVAEADFVLSRIKGYKVTLPVVFDFEYASYGRGLTGRLYNAKLSKDEATKICLAFCERVKKAGYDPMVYANKTMLTESLNESAITRAGYKVWLAHYTVKTTYTGKYDYWQYTSSGKVNGITGPVDCNFWYVWVEAKGISMSSSTATVEADSSIKLSASLTPANASNAISWSSSDTNVAEVSSDGEVTGKNGGTAVITASVGSFSAKCTVTVTIPPVRGVYIERDSYETAVDGTFTIKAHVIPEAAVNKKLTWSSDKPDVVSVDQNGKVTGVSVGKAIITATSDDGGFTKSTEVTVLEKIKSITLNKSSVTIMNGMTFAAKATILPDTTSWEVEWSSSNDLVATVDQKGLITAKGIGTAVIKATASELSAEIKVLVTGKPTTLRSSVKLGGVSSFSISDVKLEMISTADSGDTHTPKPSATEAGASFSFEVYEGEYSLSIKKPGFTSYIDSHFNVGVNTFPSTVILFPGDVNNDGHVNIRDIALEKSLLGVTKDGSSYTVSGDFDDNGAIDGKDLSALLKGYGQSDNIID